MLRTDLEYIVHCTEDGTVLGPIEKKAAHALGVKAALAHYSTWSMVYNVITDEYGLQQKNPKQHDFVTGPRRDMGVAGHNTYINEDGQRRYTTFGETLVKEAAEEIGRDVQLCDTAQMEEIMQSQRIGTRGTILKRFSYKTTEHNEYVGLGLICVASKEVTFVDGEVIDFVWIKRERIADFIATNDCCSALVTGYEKVERFLDTVM